MKEPESFEELFASAATTTPDPRETARIWSVRRGRGEPTADDVAREAVWEAIVRATEGGRAIEAIVARSDGAWTGMISGVRGRIADRYAVLADPPLVAGPRMLRVVKYDRLLETLELRPLVRGEPLA